MQVLTVVGARPQFVKAGPVSRALRAAHGERLLHTGQHYDEALSDVFFEDLQIPPPDVLLDVAGLSTGERFARMIEGIAAEVAAHRPDVVMVYGDTDSTLAGALAAREHGVPLAHVEAGLRSHNLRMPEEVNRIGADHLSALLLCPTEAAAEQARAEHVAGRIEVVGDVMLDACRDAAGRGRAAAPWTRHGLEEGGYFASTLHRAENTDDPARLRAIVRALDSLELPVLLPCHPRTRAALAREGLLDDVRARAGEPAASGGLRIVDPVRYPEMLGLVAGSRALLTDSGGLQKEAYFLSVPCVTLRDETEWTGTLHGGWNRLVGADPDRIREAAAASSLPEGAPDLGKYGGGQAATLLVAALEASFG